MTSDQQQWLAENFKILAGHNAYNRSLLNTILDAVLKQTDEDGEENWDATVAATGKATDRAQMNMEIAIETYGKSGSETVEIMQESMPPTERNDKSDIQKAYHSDPAQFSITIQKNIWRPVNNAAVKAASNAPNATDAARRMLA